MLEGSTLEAFMLEGSTLEVFMLEGSALEGRSCHRRARWLSILLPSPAKWGDASVT